MERLCTPWRYNYLVSDKSKEGCVFCTVLATGDDRAKGILLRGRMNYVILNRYPYNNGHLMVVPFRHIGGLSHATADELHELIDLTARCERVLRALYQPGGINVGINLGPSAGAGIADHYHLHLVPRWEGDTNFMTVIGDTRIIPEDLDRTWSRVKEALDADAGE